MTSGATAPTILQMNLPRGSEIDNHSGIGT